MQRVITTELFFDDVTSFDNPIRSVICKWVKEDSPDALASFVNSRTDDLDMYGSGYLSLAEDVLAQFILRNLDAFEQGDLDEETEQSSGFGRAGTITTAIPDASDLFGPDIQRIGDVRRAVLLARKLRRQEIAVQQSPIAGQQLIQLLRNGSAISMGSAIGLGGAEALGSMAWMTITLPAGVLIMHATKGIGKSLEKNLNACLDDWFRFKREQWKAERTQRSQLKPRRRLQLGDDNDGDKTA